MLPTLFPLKTMLFGGAGSDATGQAQLGVVISHHVLQAWAPTGEREKGEEPSW